MSSAHKACGLLPPVPLAVCAGVGRLHQSIRQNIPSTEFVTSGNGEMWVFEAQEATISEERAPGLTTNPIPNIKSMEYLATARYGFDAFMRITHTRLIAESLYTIAMPSPFHSHSEPNRVYFFRGPLVVVM